MPSNFVLPQGMAALTYLRGTDLEANMRKYPFMWLFGYLFLFRYLRTIVGAFTYRFYAPKPLVSDPKFTSNEVSVVIPTTFKEPEIIAQCVARIVEAAPRAIFMISASANVPAIKEWCDTNMFIGIQVLGVEKLNKRVQMIKALKEVETDVVIFADDDVFWPTNYLKYLLAVFEDPKVGAGGTRQRTRRSESPNFWNFLGIAYLERRVWNNMLTNAVDGSISTLSGRTAAYRTKILKDPDFYSYFLNDSWFGRPLNTDDDKCLTRYVYAHGHKIVIQSDPASILHTTLEEGPKYIDQCLRWARAHWRGNFTVMTNESYWRSFRYAWGFYAIYSAQFQTPALVVDSFHMVILSIAMRSFED